jgi:hypothetical protein
MDLAAFRLSLAGTAPPDGLPPAVQALWWDAKGDWDRAHEQAQVRDDADGAAVHAYLHRKEGDIDNARYWYRRAGRAPASGSLDAEWDALAADLLGR